MDNRGYLLLIEDEPVVQANNKIVLEHRGYVLKQAYTLAEARAIVAAEPPGAIVLDIQLPDGNGLDFLQELRKSSNVPVLVLTAMGTSDDIIKGLEAGGDDYLTKPHELEVFLKRVEALIRRAAMIPDKLKIGLLTLDPSSGRAFLSSEDLLLSQKEYTLLQQFVQHPEQTLSAECLFNKVWGLELPDDDSSLKNTVYRLRKKLEGSGYTIASERGEGYIFERE
ncbi:MAG: response regulator transcription factor [Oscillospiraceae bacterium]|jgi:DNA-binding response OmpR family regulator|nr:response regulator transcription factor [Oscillospiraceae bacterium]